MFRIRTTVVAVAGVLAIAVPISTASAAVSSGPPSASQSAGDITPVVQAGVDAAMSDWNTGLQAAKDDVQAGADAALSGWQTGLQGAADSLQAAANDLASSQAGPQVGP
jgi:hypothetical protein